MTDLPPITSETTGEWRRDLHFTLRCKCGHGRDEHRHDRKTSSPCYVGGCGCQHFRPDAVLFYEHRQVIGHLEETP